MAAPFTGLAARSRCDRSPGAAAAAQRPATPRARASPRPACHQASRLARWSSPCEHLKGSAARLRAWRVPGVTIWPAEAIEAQRCERRPVSSSSVPVHAQREGIRDASPGHGRAGFFNGDQAPWTSQAALPTRLSASPESRSLAYGLGSSTRRWLGDVVHADAPCPLPSYRRTVQRHRSANRTLRPTTPVGAAATPCSSR